MKGEAMTITEFLLARIAEDETVAREVSADRNGNFTGIELWAAETNGWVAVGASAERVLAECAAKRAIVAGIIPERDPQAVNPDYDPLWVMRALAAVYKDHPDYLPEWAL